MSDPTEGMTLNERRERAKDAIESLLEDRVERIDAELSEDLLKVIETSLGLDVLTDLAGAIRDQLGNHKRLCDKPEISDDGPEDATGPICDCCGEMWPCPGERFRVGLSKLEEP